MFLADTDRESIHKLAGLLEGDHCIRLAVWRDRHSYNSFINLPEDGIVFIRVDDSSIPGLELTKQAFALYPKIRLVWMAASEVHALDAFPQGVDAYLLLPATKVAINEVMACLRFKYHDTKKSNGGDDF